MVALDAVGHLQRRLPLKLPHGLSGDLSPVNLWGKADLDPAGAEELLFLNDGKLCASRADGTTVWQWSLPDDNAKLVEIQPRAAENPGTVVVWTGQSVYGLTTATGVPRWRAEVYEPPSSRGSSLPTVQVLPNGKNAALPAVRRP